MPNLIESARRYTSGRLKPDDYTLETPVILEPVEIDESMYPRGLQQQYRLVTTVGVTFWANPAQKDMATEHAYKLLAHRLYYDVLRFVPELEMAIENGDRETSRKILQLMKNEMGA